MSRYSMVERDIWRRALRKLPPFPPSAASLFLYLKNNEAHTPFPGLFLFRALVAASDLRWSVEDVERCMDEVEAAGLARWDRDAEVVWIANEIDATVARGGVTIKYAQGWRRAWNDLPDCALVRQAFAVAYRALTLLPNSEKTPVGEAAKWFVRDAPEWFRSGPPTGPNGGLDAQRERRSMPSESHSDLIPKASDIRDPDPETFNQNPQTNARAYTYAPTHTREAAPESNREPEPVVGGLFEVLRRVRCAKLAQAERTPRLAATLDAIATDNHASAELAAQALEAACADLDEKLDVHSAPGLLVCLFKRRVVASVLDASRVEEDLAETARQQAARDAANADAPRRAAEMRQAVARTPMKAFTGARPVFAAPRPALADPTPPTPAPVPAPVATPEGQDLAARAPNISVQGPNIGAQTSVAPTADAARTTGNDAHAIVLPPPRDGLRSMEARLLRAQATAREQAAQRAAVGAPAVFGVWTPEGGARVEQARAAREGPESGRGVRANERTGVAA